MFIKFLLVNNTSKQDYGSIGQITETLKLEDALFSVTAFLYT